MYSIDKIIGSASLRSSVIKGLVGKLQHFCEDDIGDILSDCYMRVWRHGDFVSEASARSWVAKAVNHAILDWIRARTGYIYKTGVSRSDAFHIHGTSTVYKIRVEDTESLDAPHGDKDMHESKSMSKFISIDPIAEFDLQCGLVQILEMARRDMGEPYHAMLDRIITDVKNGDHPKLTAEGGNKSDKTRAYRIRNYLREHMVESDWL